MENANKVIPEVEVELGGKKFTIRCSFAVLLKLQKTTGKNVFKNTYLQELSPEDMVSLIWCGISAQDPTATPEWVAENMSGQHLTTIGELIKGIFENAMPPAKEGSETAQENTTDTEKKT